MGKYCNEHYDPTCEKCKASNPEDQNKIVAEEKNEKPKGKDGLGGLIGLCVTMLIIAGFAVFMGWIAVPGFLKPDQEVPLLEVGSFVSQDGECLVRFRWKNRNEEEYIPLDRIGVALRDDGKPHTTVLLQNRKDSTSYRCSSATILVHSSEASEKWNKFFDSLKLKYEEEKKARDLYSSPHYVPPPPVTTK